MAIHGKCFLFVSGLFLCLNMGYAQSDPCSPGGPEDGDYGSGGEESPESPQDTCICDVNCVCIPVLHAFDPNDITGPLGYGDEQWVSVNDRMGYTIRFENDPDFATAPAQIVRITHPVDSNLNINSFRLGDFGFGGFFFQPPPNSAYYSDRLDVTDSLGVYVDITAGIDINKHEVFWIFESIDPATGLPPADALTGFLPVNDTTVTIYTDTIMQRGEGFVAFSIQPKNSSVTGDSVNARATIIFDDNAPIPTNTWKNLIDAFGPSSMMASLPPNSPANVLNLLWSAQDDPGGVGVGTYNLYVSRDGNPFYLFEEGIDTNYYSFTAQIGSQYGFFIRAVDHVGNIEDKDAVAETSTTVSPGLSVINLTTEFQGITDYSGNLTVELYAPMDDTSPVYSFTPAADANGFSTISGVSPGTYDILVNRFKYLTRVNANVVLAEGPNEVAFLEAESRELRVGDANDDNAVSALDFTILASTFNLQQGDAGYDGRADFNADNLVNSMDFSLLASNFNTQGEMVGGMQRPGGAVAERNLGRARLYLKSNTAEARVGEVVELQLVADAPGQALDAVEAHLAYNASRLEILAVSWSGAFDIPLRQDVDNTQGQLSLAVGTFGPLPEGHFEVARILAKTKAPGLARVDFRDAAPFPPLATYAGHNLLSEYEGAQLKILRERAMEMQVILYPLPAEGEVTLELVNAEDIGDARLRVVDISGNPVLQMNIGPEHRARFDVSGFIPGVYTVEVQSKGAVVQEKMIVQ